MIFNSLMLRNRQVLRLRTNLRVGAECDANLGDRDMCVNNCLWNNNTLGCYDKCKADYPPNMVSCTHHRKGKEDEEDGLIRW